MNFSNEQLFSKHIPHLSSILFEHLEKKYLKVMYLQRILLSFILGAILITFIILDPFDLSFYLKSIIISVVSGLIILYLILTKKIFLIKAYGIRKHDIIFRSGLIFRSTTVIPFNRVQHVEIKNGPIDRYFGLSKLNIYTAGGSLSDLSIPGLLMETAQNIKELIVGKTISDEEE